VVVRYFGGTKLGMGGLIAAYRTSAAEALQAAAIVEKRVQVLLSLRLAWPSTSFVMKIIREYGLEIVSQESDNECRMEVLVRLGLAGEIAGRLAQNEVLVEIH
jgi:putative IMPACT (imprinted ancient) family translation regulator